MKFILAVPENFNFWSTVYSHGWCTLPPFEVDKLKNRLKRVLTLSNGNSIVVEIEQHSKRRLHIFFALRLSVKERGEVLSQTRICFRLDEDYTEFYREIQSHKRLSWVIQAGAGRLLRAPTVFEDVVKMICTTNCSWALTETIIMNLCGKLGSRLQDSVFTFPSPEALANTTVKFLRKEIHSGYRSEYLLEFARRVAEGELAVESWRNSNLQSDILYREILDIKGIGRYAAGNIMKLIGRYDYLGLDSWGRKRFFEIYHTRKAPDDKIIEKFYEPFGKWKGLIFWLDVTRHWYRTKFPF